MKGSKAAVFECALCCVRFDLKDVERLHYFPSTGVCFDCYLKGQEASYVEWCFGKRNVTGKHGKVVRFGLDKHAKACSVQCPDRQFCELFVTGEILKWKGVRHVEQSNDETGESKT